MKKAVIFDMYETLITHYKSPLYFSTEMSEDAGLTYDQFYPLWKQSEPDRWVGKMTFEQCIEHIMKTYNCYSEEKLETIVEKRMATKVEVFTQLHEHIIPMLQKLKEEGIRIGLISNCFSEEVIAIRNSVLAPYFDFLCLSYEQGLQKPDPEIFHRCMDHLHVQPEECLYVGDGGSQELETAKALNMLPLQATWYFQDGLQFQSKRNPEFLQLNDPMELFEYLK